MASHSHHHRHHDQIAPGYYARSSGQPDTADRSDIPRRSKHRRASSAPAFSDLGLTFNDAGRALVGGLWQNVVEEGGQGLGSVFKYTTDLTNVQTGLQAEVAAGQFTGDTLTHVNTILADITTAISAANGFGERRRRRSAASRRRNRRCAPAISTFSTSLTTMPLSPRWRRRTARTDFSPRPWGLPTASRPKPRRTPISRRSASSSTTWRARSSAASMPTMRPGSAATSTR